MLFQGKYLKLIGAVTIVICLSLPLVLWQDTVDYSLYGPEKALVNTLNLSSWFHKHKTIDQHRIVVFTTFTEIPQRHRQHYFVIQNHALLGPAIKSVLYYVYKNASLNEIARSYGWDVHLAPKINKHGTPYVGAMFQDIFKRYNASYYCFSNGDILFSHKLVHLLDILDKTFGEKLKNKKMKLFVTGRRSNFEVLHDTPESIADPNNVDAIAESKSLYPGGEDYFIVKKDSYPWNASHDMLVGRPGIDNYIMSTAVNRCLDILDVTYTMKVLHLTGPSGTLTSFTKEVPDSEANSKILTDQFDWTMAQTANSVYETYYDTDKVIRIRPRSYLTSILDMPDTIRELYLKFHGLEAHHETRCNKTTKTTKA